MKEKEEEEAIVKGKILLWIDGTLHYQPKSLLQVGSYAIFPFQSTFVLRKKIEGIRKQQRLKHSKIKLTSYCNCTIILFFGSTEVTSKWSERRNGKKGKMRDICVIEKVKKSTRRPGRE